MSPEHLAEWRRTRRGGKLRFLVLRTVRHCFLFCPLFGVMIPYYRDGGWEGVTDQAPETLLLRLVTGVFAAFSLAHGLWSVSESQYLKANPGEAPA